MAEQSVRETLRDCIVRRYDESSLSLEQRAAIAERSLEETERSCGGLTGAAAMHALSETARQHMKDAVADASRELRIPVHTVQKVAAIVGASRRMKHTLGREPSDGELAQALSMQEDELRLLLELTRDT